MGWLKDKVERERRLRERAPELWEGLITSMEVAAADAKELCHGGVAVDRQDSLTVVLTAPGSGLRIGFDPREPYIWCVVLGERGRPFTEQRLGFTFAGEDVSLALEGKPISIEQACQLLTGPIFR